MAATDYAAIAQGAQHFDKQFLSKIINGLDFINDMKVHRKVSGNGLLLPKLTVNGGIRPQNFNVEDPKGTNRSWSGRKLYVKPAMKIISIVPDEARETFEDDGLDNNASELPFGQWVWQREFDKIKQEINDNMYFGVDESGAAAFNAGSAYAVGDYISFENVIYQCVTITTAGQSPTTHPAKWTDVDHLVISEGPGTIIANEVTATNITPIVTGALSNTNALTKVELMYKDMTAAHRNLGGIFRMSTDNFRNYIEHERATYGNAANADMGDGKKYVYGSGKKWEIRECTWMGTSGRVIATQKENLRFGTNMEAKMSSIGKVVETLHGYKAVVKWLQGFEIADLETLYVNDQA